MIILASDYVGFRVVEYLTNIKEHISFLVLDKKDKGGYNGDIEELYRSSYQSSYQYNNIGTIITDEDLRDDNMLNNIESKKPNIGILAWWPYILKGKILDTPRLGWVNLHPSYLPYNRGKHPNFWCLAEGTPCGISIHFVDKGIDSGDIITQKRLDVGWEDTGETIYKRSRDAIVDLFKEHYFDIKNNRLTRTKQNLNNGTFHKSKDIDKVSLIDIDTNYRARDLLNIIRAKMFSQHPTAYFYDNNKKYSIKIIIKEIDNTDTKIDTKIDNK